MVLIIGKGIEITPRHQAAIIAFQSFEKPVSYSKIQKLTGVSVSTANDIWRHALCNAQKQRIEEEEDDLARPFSLLELISAKVLDPNARSGRPAALTEYRLVAFVKQNFTTRRMKLVDIRQEAGLSHVCNGTVFNALVERGLGAYREEFEFILNPECNAKRLVSSRYFG